MMRWHPTGQNLENDASIHLVRGHCEEGVGIHGADLLTPEADHRTLCFIRAAQQDRSQDLGDPRDGVGTRLGKLCRLALEDQDRLVRRRPVLNVDIEPEVTAAATALGALSIPPFSSRPPRSSAVVPCREPYASRCSKGC